MTDYCDNPDCGEGLQAALLERDALWRAALSLIPDGYAELVAQDFKTRLQKPCASCSGFGRISVLRPDDTEYLRDCKDCGGTGKATSWRAALVECRVCGYRHASAYPASITEEDRQQCPRCRALSAEPIPDAKAEGGQS